MKNSNSHVYHTITLKNTITGETVSGLHLQTEEIDGKKFFVLQVGNKMSKFSQDGFKIVKR